MRFMLLGGLLMFSAGAEMAPVDSLPEKPELPEALVAMDGTPITTAEEWHEKRRPELVALFQHYMYGFAPESPGIVARIERDDADACGGKATLRQIEITFAGLPDSAPRIHLLLFLPNVVEGPVPVFVMLNRCGNYAVHDDPRILVREGVYANKECAPADAGGRGGEKAAYSVERFIERGYGFATFHQSDIDPDINDFTDGIHPFLPVAQPADAQWATLRAWAWGLSRCLDYLVTEPRIDAARIGVSGHSRRGKTALLAAALDERFALAAPHQAGTGGTALSRDNTQETVKLINDRFPHWFNGNFKKFNDAVTRLPFDQHLLMALVAPRALIDTEGIQDKWASPDGALRALRAADPVYKLLGAPGMSTDSNGLLEKGAAITPENAGNLLQYRLDTRHEMNPDYWEKVLDFADVVLK